MNKYDYDYQEALIKENEELRRENKELRAQLERFENEGGSPEKDKEEYTNDCF
ncbi:hypothetical protein [Staphylococcus phage vB_SsapH-Golestan-100]|nr:hypothetical protein [Staphylococcus phage vB_SsapH-Golestan-100]